MSVIECWEVSSCCNDQIERHIDYNGNADNLFNSSLNRIDELWINREKLDLASVSKESNASSSEEVQINVECFNLCMLIVLVDVGWHFNKQNDASVEQGTDWSETDVPKTTHILD